MSDAVKAVIGVALIVASIEFPWLSPVAAKFLFAAGASLVLNAAAAQFGPKGPRAPTLNGIAINYSGTLEPRRIIYGTIKMGGTNAIPPP